jgi:putative acetyltransferase
LTLSWSVAPSPKTEGVSRSLSLQMLSIRKAEPEDCPAIARVHTSAVRAISSNVYTRDEIESWARPHPPETYELSIAAKEFYVVTDADVIVGFGVLNPQTREIEAVYASPDVTRRGVGIMILAQLESRALELGLETLSLNASLNAVGFYKRAGYVPQAESKYRLRSGVEIRCVPMIKQLESTPVIKHQGDAHAN